MGLPASPAVQCPGLTGTGRHCADEHTDRAARKEPCPPSADDGNAHPPGLDLRLPQSNDGPPTPAAAVSAVTSTAYACGRPCGRRACGRRGRHFRQPPPPSTVAAGTIRRGFRQTPAKSSKALQQNARSSKTLQQNSSKTPAKLQQNAGTAQLQQNAGTAQQNAGTACPDGGEARIWLVLAPHRHLERGEWVSPSLAYDQLQFGYGSVAARGRPSWLPTIR